MEYCSKGDLFDFLKHKARGQLSSEVANSLFSHILTGIDCLHERGAMAHLDIKLENVLLSEDYQVKICDLGFSQSAHDRLFQCAGTDGYKAPEIHKTVEGGFFSMEDADGENTLENGCIIPELMGYSGVKADIFALGVILFTLHFGIPPFTEARMSDRFYKLLNFKSGNDKKTNLRFFLKNHPATKDLLASNSIDYELLDLISTLLAENPNERPSSIS